MAKKTAIVLPKTEELLRTFGENIRLARLRRNITAKLEAERAGISIVTLAKIENGAPTVAIGHYTSACPSADAHRNGAEHEHRQDYLRLLRSSVRTTSSCSARYAHGAAGPGQGSLFVRVQQGLAEGTSRSGARSGFAVVRRTSIHLETELRTLHGFRAGSLGAEAHAAQGGIPGSPRGRIAEDSDGIRLSAGGS